MHIDPKNVSDHVAQIGWDMLTAYCASVMQDIGFLTAFRQMSNSKSTASQSRNFAKKLQQLTSHGSGVSATEICTYIKHLKGFADIANRVVAGIEDSERLNCVSPLELPNWDSSSLTHAWDTFPAEVMQWAQTRLIQFAANKRAPGGNEVYVPFHGSSIIVTKPAVCINGQDGHEQVIRTFFASLIKCQGKPTLRVRPLQSAQVGIEQSLESMDINDRLGCVDKEPVKTLDDFHAYSIKLSNKYGPIAWMFDVPLGAFWFDLELDEDLRLVRQDQSFTFAVPPIFRDKVKTMGAEGQEVLSGIVMHFVDTLMYLCDVSREKPRSGKSSTRPSTKAVVVPFELRARDLFQVRSMQVLTTKQRPPNSRGGVRRAVQRVYTPQYKVVNGYTRSPPGRKGDPNAKLVEVSGYVRHRELRGKPSTGTLMVVRSEDDN